MKKKQIANVIMAAVIVVIVAAGVLCVGFIQGWFDSPEEGAVLADIRGIVYLERDGVSFPVEEDTVLRTGDRLSCTSGATAAVYLDGQLVQELDSSSIYTVLDPSVERFSMEAATVTETTEAAEATEPADTIPETVPAQTEPEESEPEETEPAETVPSQTQATQPAATEQAQETQPAVTEPVETAPAETVSPETVPAATEPVETVPAETEPVQTEPALTCTIAIRCDTILNNMESLNPAKAPYVPSDGWILWAELSFEQGETVFDVLKRACENYGIQIEYSWTPMYDSYYVEGINHIYEFDCGYESGWMYAVNGWYPNYGCSSYTLEDGDYISWNYTCVGMGADLGASV